MFLGTQELFSNISYSVKIKFRCVRPAISSEYANIKQRWLVIESEIRKQAAIKKIAEQVEKQLESAQASVRKLSRQ